MSSIARRQLLDAFASPRFIIAAALCVLTGVGITWVRTSAYEQALREYRLIRAEDSREASGYTGPHPLTYLGVSITRKPNVLGIFYAGLQPARPVSIRVAANRDPAVEAQYERSNPVPHLFLNIDFVLFVALVISVMAIAMNYDAVSGEKERGTLKLTLSFPVPRHELLIGKALGGLAALGVPLLLVALGSLLVVVMSPEAQLDGADVVVVAALTASAMAFVAAMISLTIAVSCLTAKAFTTVTVMASLWVLMAIGIPGVSPYVARFLSPVPSAHEVESDKWAITQEENGSRYQRIVEYRKNPADNPLDQMVFYSELFRESFLATANRQEQVHADFERKLHRQIDIAGWISRLSPMASLIYTAGNLTDTGLRDAFRFRRDLQRYRVRFLNYAEDKWVERERNGTGAITTEDYPRFVSLRPGLEDRMGASLIDIGLLGAWVVVFFAVSLVAFLRYDPR